MESEPFNSDLYIDHSFLQSLLQIIFYLCLLVSGMVFLLVSEY